MIINHDSDDDSDIDNGNNNNNNFKKERICKIVDFAVPADHKIKLKECEKMD